MISLRSMLQLGGKCINESFISRARRPGLYLSNFLLGVRGRPAGTNINFIIPTGAQRSGGICSSLNRHPVRTVATTLTFVIPPAPPAPACRGACRGSAVEGPAVVSTSSCSGWKLRRVEKRLRSLTGYDRKRRGRRIKLVQPSIITGESGTRE
jgi:hypothetical protein